MLVSTAKVKPILESMYQCRKEMVPCFIGAPGIGKTQGLYEFAREKGVNVVTFILSNTVPSEVSGIRMPDKESKRMEVFDDMRMSSLRDGDILFFDEILEAPPMLWSACLTLIQDRIMASGRKLPDVFIVAASNRVASPGIIPASVRNRFQFIELTFDADNWCRWMLDTYNVEPSRKLVKRIEEDSTSYNVLTPREVVKLYLYMKQAVKDGTSDTAKEVTTAMFDEDISGWIYELAITKTPQKIQLRNALIEIDPEIQLPENFMSMSYKDILNVLMEMENWDEISKALGTIDLE